MNKLLNLSRRASYDEDIIHIDKYIERVTNPKLKKESCQLWKNENQVDAIAGGDVQTMP